MRRVKGYRIDDPTFEEKRDGRYFLRPVFVYRDRNGAHRVRLGASFGDEISVFREENRFYIVGINELWKCVGLYEVVGGECVGRVTMNEAELKKVVGSRGLNLRPVNIAKRLRRYIKTERRSSADNR